MANSKTKAAPFFTSYGRIISYKHPEYHLVNNKLVKIEGDIKDSRKIDPKTTWELEDCNLQNKKSEKSLDMVKIKPEKVKNEFHTIVGKRTDLSSKTQRFNVGISGKWSLISTELGRPLLRDKKAGYWAFSESEDVGAQKFRWNARQMMTSIGNPLERTLNGIQDTLSSLRILTTLLCR